MAQDKGAGARRVIMSPLSRNFAAGIAFPYDLLRSCMNGLIQLEALGRLRQVPRRRPHLSLQRRRTGRARHRHRPGQFDVRRLGRCKARVVYTPVETCELNGADPPASVAHVLAKPRDRPLKRRDEWPPRKFTPRQRAIGEAALATAAAAIREYPRRGPDG
jgi:hypothetical protein